MGSPESDRIRIAPRLLPLLSCAPGGRLPLVCGDVSRRRRTVTLHENFKRPCSRPAVSFRVRLNSKIYYSVSSNVSWFCIVGCRALVVSLGCQRRMRSSAKHPRNAMTVSAMPMAAAAPRSSMELRNIEASAAAEVMAIVTLVFVIGFICF